MVCSCPWYETGQRPPPPEHALPYSRFARRLSHKPRCVRLAVDDLVVPQNFIGCDREQAFLLPPSLREWLPGDHLAWFVLDAVAEMDVDRFYADYRADGHGRAA